jgi:hypothetical protein
MTAALMRERAEFVSQATHQTALNAIERLRAALRGLLPRGWRDGTMDHMPGVKAAREALGEKQK